jgi:two-component system, LytTR family, sensor kinase
MKKSVVLLSHIGFWVMIWILLFTVINLIPFLPKSYDKYNPLLDWDLYLGALSGVGILMVPFYFGFLYTKLIIKNIRFIYYPLLLIIPVYFLLSYKGDYSYRFVEALMPILIFLFFALWGGLFQLFSDWFKKNKLKIELERKNYESNFALLRSQINPHFLFNTLHNIDTLIYGNQDKASKSLVKLSDIMRYMLKDAKLDFVELSKEIEHLESYLSLEKLRLKNETFLDYTIKGDSKGIKIAPMIIIPFVENAFKHCVDSSIENGIIIKITVENKKLIFVCENQFDKTETDKDKVHGIGLETVKKRLDLIYKNQHKLSINSEDSVYKVNLELELNEN